MSIRIPTHELVGLLTDLTHTASDPADSSATASVLLHTARGHYGDQPGKSDLLVGTSSNSYTVGHAHTSCSGQGAPMLWPIGHVRSVIAVFKPLAKDHDHAVEITTDGDTIVVAEDPDLFGERLSISFTGIDKADYPTKVIRDALADIRVSPSGDAQPAVARTDLKAHVLAPFLKVATRRSTLLEVYRYHQHLPIHVQIGPQYRGIALPFRWWDEDRSTGNAPSGDVYPLESITPSEEDDD